MEMKNLPNTLNSPFQAVGPTQKASYNVYIYTYLYMYMYIKRK